MGMSVGPAGQRAEINMTPLIDVLLVLLIIFMVITPIDPVGLPVHTPQQAPEAAPAYRRNDVVLMVRGNGIVEINQHPVAVEDLSARLIAIFGGSPLATVFIAGEKELEFRHVARVIDLARGAGVKRIGLM